MTKQIDYTCYGTRELIERINELESDNRSMCDQLEEYDMILSENKNMAEALKNLGYTPDQISDICSGAPIIK
jgi:Holliday junction resolvasome RuvABC DNA-binding subunit